MKKTFWTIFSVVFLIAMAIPALKTLQVPTMSGMPNTKDPLYLIAYFIFSIGMGLYIGGAIIFAHFLIGAKLLTLSVGLFMVLCLSHLRNRLFWTFTYSGQLTYVVIHLLTGYALLNLFIPPQGGENWATFDSLTLFFTVLAAPFAYHATVAVLAYMLLRQQVRNIVSVVRDLTGLEI